MAHFFKYLAKRLYLYSSSWKTTYTMIKKINKKFLSSIGKLIESGSIDKKDFIVLIISLLILYIFERASQKIQVRKKNFKFYSSNQMVFIYFTYSSYCYIGYLWRRL